ncbi:MAG TPA: hypothetical protein PLZ06_01065 [Clostridia bacterium]|jgi:hypothetical protein|nr:hypothetical protein [Clostridia bacterium]HQC67854.1 hypothetical protein [Clostridia bacterium]
MEKANKIKKTCMIFQTLLLMWFFLDMTGVSLGDKCLVTQSYREDGVFFLIYLFTVILFIVKVHIGKWLVVVWTSLWFIAQFLSHEWYTIFNCGIMGSVEGKIKYFSGTLQWIRIEGKYIPDIYHTVLHILILLVLISTIIYIVKSKKKVEVQI